MKNIQERNNCSWGCQGNIIKNVDHYENLKSRKQCIWNCIYDSYLNYGLKDLKIFHLCVKWNIVCNKLWLNVIFWPSTQPKNAIPRWCTWRKWHIPMASNRKRSHGWIKADNMGQGEGPTVPLQSDAPEESDLWTAWQLFPLDDD